MKGNVLSVDIGGSKIMVAIVNENGLLVKSEKRLLPEKYDAKFLTDEICNMIEPLLKENPVCIGVAVPGLADSETGVWKYAPFSNVSQFPICEILSEKTGLPCFAENDVNVCAIGEKDYGVCKDDDDFLWMTVSNGVGGALFLNGKLYTGKKGNAGEIGHFYISDKSYVCGCGKKGCLETFASGYAIQKEYQKRTGVSERADVIASKARLGEETAKAVFNRAGHALGKAISYGINLLNIDKIVLGGGVAQSFDLLLPSINKTIKKYVFSQANVSYSIEKTGLGYNAAIIGAAAFARRKINKI